MKACGRGDVYLRKTLVSILLFILASTAWTQEANPGRPTISTPATLTPVGYLQFESGVLVAEHSGEFANRTGINEVIKFAPAKRLQLLVSAEPFASSDLGDHRSKDAGGVALGFQTVLFSGEGRKPTISASYF